MTSRVAAPVIYFSIVGVLALLSQSPEVLIIALFMAILPGLILIVANSLLIYSVALLPLYVARPWLKRAPWIALFALIPTAMLAMLPRYLAEPEYTSYVQHLRAQDFTSPAMASPRSIGLSASIADSGGDPSCNQLCQRLLYDGGVETVIAQFHRTAPLAFRVERRERCPEMLGATHASQLRMLGGECIVSQSGAGIQPDVYVATQTVNVREEHPGVYESEANRFRLWTVREIETFEISERRGEELALAERVTKVSGGLAAAPYFVGVQSGGYMAVFISAGRLSVITPDESIEGILLRRYNWDAREGPEPHFVAANAEAGTHIQEVLAREYAPGEELTRAEQSAVANGVRAIQRAETVSAADVETVRRAMNLRANGVLLTLRWRPEFAPLIPDAVALLEAPVTQENDNTRYMPARFLYEASPELLRPYADRIVAVLNDPERSRYATPMLRTLHRYVDAPGPLLLRFMGAGAIYSQDAVQGLCHIAVPGDAAQMRAFDAVMVSGELGTWGPYEYRAAYAGLHRTGGGAAVRRLEAQLRGHDLMRNLRHAQRNARIEGWPGACSP